LIVAVRAGCLPVNSIVSWTGFGVKDACSFIKNDTGGVMPVKDKMVIGVIPDIEGPDHVLGSTPGKTTAGLATKLRGLGQQ